MLPAWQMPILMSLSTLSMPQSQLLLCVGTCYMMDVTDRIVNSAMTWKDIRVHFGYEVDVAKDPAANSCMDFMKSCCKEFQS